MYNLTVDEAHTFFVGNGAWLVHNQDQYPSQLPVTDVFYTQNSYNILGKHRKLVNGRSVFDGFYTLFGNSRWLAQDPNAHLPAIKVFRMTSDLLNLPDQFSRDQRFNGSVRNLVIGRIYTLENRRLATYRMAGRPTIPVEWITEADKLQESVWQFTTTNSGTSAKPELNIRDYLEFIEYCERG
jgi:hypothetical protein